MVTISFCHLEVVSAVDWLSTDFPRRSTICFLLPHHFTYFFLLLRWKYPFHYVLDPWFCQRVLWIQLGLSVSLSVCLPLCLKLFFSGLAYYFFWIFCLICRFKKHVKVTAKKEGKCIIFRLIINTLELLLKSHYYIFLKLYWWQTLKISSATKQYFLKMCHLRHGLRIFLVHRKVMFCSQDIQAV